MEGMWRGLAIALIVIGMFSPPGFGQAGPTSSLSGAVVDPSGAVVPGAEVTARNNATGTEFKALTVENGTYAMPVLDAGTYTVTVSLPGFKQAIVNNVKLDVGVPATVRVTLEIGGATEEVSVEVGAEILQSQSATIATTIQVSQISNLPLVSRDPLNLPDFRADHNRVFGLVEYPGSWWQAGADRREDQLLGGNFAIRNC